MLERHGECVGCGFESRHRLNGGGVAQRQSKRMSRKDRAPRQSILVPAVEGHRGLSVESDFEASLSPPLRYEEDGNLLARDARETQFNSGVPDEKRSCLGRGNTEITDGRCRL